MPRRVLAAVLALAAASGPAAAGDACAPLVLPSTAQLRGVLPSYPVWVYAMLGDGTTDLGFGGPEPDDVQIEFYTPAVGTFDLGAGDEANFATCRHCLLISEDLDGLFGRKSYFPAAGTLSIDTAPGAQELAVTLSGLRLVEVEIDPATSVSTPVPGGACFAQAVDDDAVFADGFDAG